MMKNHEHIELAIAAALLKNKVIAESCSDRVYPVKMPQDTLFPCVVYQRLQSSPEYTLRGFSAETVTLMFNSFASNYETAKQLAMAVRSVLAAFPVHAVLRDENDLYNNEAEVYCISAKYLCHQPGGYDL